MKYKSYTVSMLVFVLAVSFFLSLLSTLPSTYPATYASAEKFWRISINVSAPANSTLEAGTPIITKLESLADVMPSEVDPFGEKTVGTGDNVDWAATYLFLGNTRIPHQIDDVDGVPGFSLKDELAFQTSSTIAAGSSQNFSLYFTTMAVELPAPHYPPISTVIPYPLRYYLDEVFGGPTIGESYAMQNGNVSAVVLVEGAWSSSCLYQLIVNETGFDAVKQNLKVETQTEPYKWTRFACPADIGWIENNPDPTNGVFERLFIKPGPVRSIVKMRSTAYAGKTYDGKTGIYALVTYRMYANQSWLDYQLDITGPGVISGMTLDVNFGNREWATGIPGTIYDTVYIPGRGDLDRGGRFDVLSGGVAEGWYITYDKSEGKGFGMSFDMEELNMFAWSGTTEGVSLLYGNPKTRTGVCKWSDPTMDAIGMKFPFHARYYPIDSSITANATEYMATMYAQWLTGPEVTVQPAEETTLPFNYVKVTTPTLTFNTKTEILNITGVTAACNIHGTMNDTNAEVAKFFVYSSIGMPTGVESNLAWTGSNWQALNVNLSLLPEDEYHIFCYFKDEDAEGRSRPSPIEIYHISVAILTLTLKTRTLNITGVTAVCPKHGTINDINAEVARFFVYSSDGNLTGVEGNLAWSGTDWQAINVDLFSLPVGPYYVLCYFEDEDSLGWSGPSRTIQVRPLKEAVSCDSIGASKEIFTTDETVYVWSSGFEANKTVYIYVVTNRTWTNGQAIQPYILVVNATTDSEGNLSITDLGTLPIGQYDIIIDANNNSIYDDQVDAVDHVTSLPGLIVIPEFPFSIIIMVACIVTTLVVHIRHGKQNRQKMEER